MSLCLYNEQDIKNEVVTIFELKAITKGYKSGDFVQTALDKVSVEFRENEFVAILGESGSGKTTLLNIIGGLDRYDSGDLIINGKSTKAFKNEDWDAYRNNRVGFIFQSYNLIGHISVVRNVEMSLTLSGVSKAERRKRAMEALERVGIKDHANKKPGQLSGGQAQRVAIARALVNNPDVILADEPTGALDSETSASIMDLIAEIAGDKLVIMVTHNPALAQKYATRIIKLKDGRVVDDTNPVKDSEAESDGYKVKKTAMSFFTALSLSFNNIRTKKGRTILTAFASSIGIIGIALILSLSNGFKKQVDNYESDTLAGFPIIISRQAMTMDTEKMKEMRNEMMGTEAAYPEEKEVYPYNSEENRVVVENHITEQYEEYIRKMDMSLVSSIMYTRAIGLNAFIKTDDGIKYLSDGSISFSCMPENPNAEQTGVVEENYDLLAGRMPENKNDVLLVVDKYNRLDAKAITALGLDKDSEAIAFYDLLGLKLLFADNNDYYVETSGVYLPATDLEAVYESDSSIEVNICGIVRIIDGSYLTVLNEGIVYTPELMEELINNAKASDVVKAQLKADNNVLTGQKLDLNTEEGKSALEGMLQYLGADSAPVAISLFPTDFDAKEQIVSYLDAYNDGKDEADMIVYTDLAETISSLSGNIMDAITIVLIAFSSISLVVSVLMIGIITYISVLERTREIGVLRAIGARKKDITRVFNAETFIIGVCSGLIGIGIARLLVFPTNMILKNLTDVENIAQLNPWHALILVGISVALTILGGLIPAGMAARKDPVVALRTE